MIPIDIPPALWLPPKPAIVKAENLDDSRLLAWCRRKSAQARQREDLEREATFPFPIMALYNRPASTIAYVTNDVSSGNASSYNFSASSFGGATTADKIIVAVWSWGAPGLTSVTIDGVSASVAASIIPDYYLGIVIANATGNASGAVVVTFSGSGSGRAAMFVYRATNVASLTPAHTVSSASGSSPGGNLTVPSRGVVVGMGSASNSNPTWTGLAADSAGSIEDTSTRYSAASAAFATGQSPLAVSHNGNSTSGKTASMVAASFR